MDGRGERGAGLVQMGASVVEGEVVVDEEEEEEEEEEEVGADGARLELEEASRGHSRV